MKKRIYIVLTLLLLLALAAVFLAPSVDLEPSALRAARAAAILFLSIFIASHLLLALASNPLQECRAVFERRDSDSTVTSDLSLLDLYCTRLC